MRATKSDPSSARDFGFIAILLMVALIAAWLLLMPVVPSIAKETMQRFHLRSDSFAAFVAEFPIPTMYNFANRFEVKDFPPGLVDPIFGELDEGESFRYINHFPARAITFSGARYRHLRDGRDRWFTLESSYRGQGVRSEVHAKAREEGGYQYMRLETP